MKPYLPRTRASIAGEAFIKARFTDPATGRSVLSEDRAFAYVDMFVAGYTRAEIDQSGSQLGFFDPEAARETRKRHSSGSVGKLQLGSSGFDQVLEDQPAFRLPHPVGSVPLYRRVIQRMFGSGHVRRPGGHYE
ncbi:hypothetical protein OVY48_10050 [Sphingobium sp. SA2]|uniref:hypothetical protein n=1 Tax=Sphingobium sp. SA2 TaxID=1524832 RepID=UPI0028BFBA8C|nr:hypothetical protein [Sphingobium sp. SA2]MDT7533766.1 hypothetical protein [Sphingobium sp. SA2]